MKTGMKNLRHASISAFLGYADSFEEEQRHKARQAMNGVSHVRAGIPKAKHVKKSSSNALVAAKI